MPTWGWVLLSIALTGSGGTVATSMGTFDFSTIDPARLALFAAFVFVSAVLAGVGFLIYVAIAKLGTGALEIHTTLVAMATKVEAFESVIDLTQQSAMHATWNSGRITGIERTLEIPTPDFPAHNPSTRMVGDRRVGDGG